MSGPHRMATQPNLPNNYQSFFLWGELRLPLDTRSATITKSSGKRIGPPVKPAVRRTVGRRRSSRQNRRRVSFANFQATMNGAAAYGHTAALGVNDPGWIVGSATLNPSPANPANGSEAFVYVP